MHRAERETITICAACGGPVSDGIDRGYAFEADAVVCWQCAVGRGGRYDAGEDRWIEPPEVEDLRSEG